MPPSLARDPWLGRARPAAPQEGCSPLGVLPPPGEKRAPELPEGRHLCDPERVHTDLTQQDGIQTRGPLHSLWSRGHRSLLGGSVPGAEASSQQRCWQTLDHKPPRYKGAQVLPARGSRQEASEHRRPEWQGPLQVRSLQAPPVGAAVSPPPREHPPRGLRSRPWDRAWIY